MLHRKSKNLIKSLALLAMLAGCAYPDGTIDPTSTALAVGAGAVAVGSLGYIAGQNSNYYAPRGYYAPRPYYAPRGYYSRPPAYYYRPRGYYYR